MITKSDNDATSALWRQLKAARVKAFLRAAGMTRTVPGSGGYWGLTQITANDEEKLLERVTRPNAVLDEDSRTYIRELMHDVVPSQRWGTPAGAPRGTTIQVKNGWLSRATHGWRVHSIGAFTWHGQDYTLTVLTQDNARMKDGVATDPGGGARRPQGPRSEGGDGEAVPPDPRPAGSDARGAVGHR